MDPNKVEKILENKSECKFGDNKRVCSPKNIITKMAEMIEVKSNDDHAIVETIKKKLNCDSESCVLKSKEFLEFANMASADHILNEFFKPEGPDAPTGLLSNFNIDDVLSQLEQTFDGFLHIPFQMRDFQEISTELAKVDLVHEFKKGVKKFGVVLNTDYSRGKGIHWYCIFGENFGNKINIEYFNSSGREPLPETQAWLQKTKHYLTREMKIPVEIIYNTGIQFQNDQHSCGVYCLMYIWFRLQGFTSKWFKPENFNDDMMLKARKVLFRKN